MSKSNFFTALMIIISAVLFLPSFILSQDGNTCNPCLSNPDCTWSDRICVYPVRYCEDFFDERCSSTICYRKMDCYCGNEHIRALKVEDIYWDLDDCSINTTKRQMIKMAMRYLLDSYTSIFGLIDTTSQHSDIKVLTPACWTEQELSGNIIRTWPCDNDECCRTEYNVYRAKYPYPPERYKTVISFSTNIWELNDTICTLPVCHFVCDSIKIDNGWAYKTPARTPSDIYVADVNVKNTSFVVPNPSDGMSEIRYQSNLQGLLTLKVFDSRGKEINRLKFEKIGTEIIFPISLNKIPNGIYFYNILSDDIIISTGNFIILK